MSLFDTLTPLIEQAESELAQVAAKREELATLSTNRERLQAELDGAQAAVETAASELVVEKNEAIAALNAVASEVQNSIDALHAPE